MGSGEDIRDGCDYKKIKPGVFVIRSVKYLVGHRSPHRLLYRKTHHTDEYKQD